LRELHENLTRVKHAQLTQEMNASIEDQKLVAGETAEAIQAPQTEASAF
jgi:hypothetical protein